MKSVRRLPPDLPEQTPKSRKRDRNFTKQSGHKDALVPCYLCRLASWLHSKLIISPRTTFADRAKRTRRDQKKRQPSPTNYVCLFERRPHNTTQKHGKTRIRPTINRLSIPELLRRSPICRSTLPNLLKRKLCEGERENPIPRPSDFFGCWTKSEK